MFSRAGMRCSSIVFARSTAWTASNTTIIQFDTEGSSMFFLMDGVVCT